MNTDGVACLAVHRDRQFCAQVSSATRRSRCRSRVRSIRTVSLVPSIRSGRSLRVCATGRRYRAQTLRSLALRIVTSSGTPSRIAAAPPHTWTPSQGAGCALVIRRGIRRISAAIGVVKTCMPLRKVSAATQIRLHGRSSSSCHPHPAHPHLTLRYDQSVPVPVGVAVTRKMEQHHAFDGGHSPSHSSARSRAALVIQR